MHVTRFLTVQKLQNLSSNITTDDSPVILDFPQKSSKIRTKSRSAGA